MKITDIRASLKRLAERLDNQWAYAQTSITSPASFATGSAINLEYLAEMRVRKFIVSM